MLTLTDLWRSFSTGELVVIALGLVASFGMLAIAYAKTMRWDRAWKERWEQRHGRSLKTLRENKHRMLKVAIALRWFMLALVFMSIGASFGPIVSVIKGLQREPALIIVGYAVLNLITLFGLALTATGVELTKYQLKRINELLTASPQQ
jgi:hypothetical protein